MNSSDEEDPQSSDVHVTPTEQIIVGVDVGLTYTGVAFSTIDKEVPAIITDWPGSKDKVAWKVPTRVGYRAGCKRYTSWGFECPVRRPLEYGMDVIDCFKLYLDPTFLKDSPKSKRDKYWMDEDVQMWFKDFLTALHQHVIEYLNNKLQERGLGDMNSNRVKYIFSFPTIWKNTNIVKIFKDLVTKAGFGNSEHHSVTIRMTEAEAAAVYAARPVHNRAGSMESASEYSVEVSPLQQGDTLLICDSGGGTTDLCVLKVGSIRSYEQEEGQIDEILELEELGFDNGKALGSARIDEAFQKEVERRLELIRPDIKDRYDLSPYYAAYDMTKSDFEKHKVEFGRTIQARVGDIRIRVPGLPKDFNHTEAKISNGRMTFTEKDIRQMFDPLIDRILEIIDEQLQRLQRLDPPERVKHFVISGGLGSSRYVQDRIREAYGEVEERQILIPEKPQLAVCRGLVIDRIHRLKYNHSMVSLRCCRFSYGVLINQPAERQGFFKKRSDGQRYTRKAKSLEQNPLDGNAYNVHQICWFIKEGQRVKGDDSICYKFYHLFETGSSDVVWKNTVVMSKYPAKHLPQTFNDEDCEVILEIESKLDGNMLARNEDHVKSSKGPRKFRNKDGPPKLQYEIVASIGLLNLRFEVRFAGNVIGEGRPIPVEWSYADVQETQRMEIPVDWRNVGQCDSE